nr:nucleolar and coiled-body phosphoprotein 1-like isoform X1 [Onthophagus taurus]XP_022907855.1 nucleolar and coiled-body phosphoprotein 1-like isoform X1 [Onthophagus taurus]
MCLTCTRGWTILHVLWSFVYVCCGAAQLVSGIFLFVSVPSLHLSSNLWVGTWDILIGIGIGMLACFCSLSKRRQEILLYLTISILVANAINVVITEWSFYVNDMKEMVGAHRYTILIEYACWTTRASSALLIFTTFLDAQLSFCSIQTAPKPQSVKMKKPPRGSHEQVSDIEYIIPRRKSSKPPSTATVCNVYSQSWVYDAETANNTFGNNHHHHQQENGCNYQTQRDQSSGLYLTLPQEEVSTKIVKRKNSLDNVMVSSDKAHLIDNPVVHIEEASDDSNSNNDRKLCYMKSFSRSTSPVIISPSSSQISLNNPPPIYECLQKLTEPEIYRTRLTSALSNKSDEYQAPQPVMVRTTSPQVEKVQYASLMKELEKVIVNKKEPSPPTPSNNNFQSSESSTSSSSKQTCSSQTSKTSKTSKSSKSSKSSKNSDAEFSKELEAALQLIQDLESPNTIETPSEHKIFDPNWRNSTTSSEEDEKTLAEIVTPTDEYQPEQLSTFKPATLKGQTSSSRNGKGACIIIHSESQSTSGYSSPTHKTPNWSTTSSVNSSNNDHNLDLRKTIVSCTIRNTKSSAVISIYNSPEDNQKTKNVTLVKINGGGEEEKISPLPPKTPNYEPSLIQDNHQQKIKKDSTNLWSVKSLLRKKKNNKTKMCPELEEAIIKSESLAYLSENELLARHQRNKDIHRQIEQRVLQQLGVPRNESQC